MLRMTPRRTLLAAIAAIAALHPAGRRTPCRRTTAAEAPHGLCLLRRGPSLRHPPSPFYDDTDFTPQGRLKWDTERYRSKIRRTAAVIDSMALPLVALYGVENERVVRDLAAACRGDYSYLHRTLNTLDGLDFAPALLRRPLLPPPHRTGRPNPLRRGDSRTGYRGAAARPRPAHAALDHRRTARGAATGQATRGRQRHPARRRPLATARRHGPRRRGRARHGAQRRTVGHARPHTRGSAAGGLTGRCLRPPVACRSFDGRPAPNHRPAALSGRIRSLTARIRIHTVDFFGGFEKFCYIRNPFTGNRLTCGRRKDAATLFPSSVETFFCNFLI